ncbi:MAG TPA: hypothetical protein VN663_22790 [Ramlibacter sp.]|nr:hypothetical protein [Ramlibacter sp.]
MFLEQVGDGFLKNQRMIYVLKSRQLGISTITTALLLFWVAVHPRTIAALVCNDEEVRNAFRDTLDRYMKSFPPNFFGSSFVKQRHNERHFLFSNGSRIDYLVAGKRKENWGESRGYSACLCTEVASYGSDKGIKSFMEALAQSNEDRLFLFESTAKGVANAWHDMWESAEDELSINRIFLGWWASEMNYLPRNSPNYRRFGLTPPNGEEHQLCNEVLEEYGHVVTMEQLAWWRWRLSLSDQQSQEQNQPWTARQAFVLSGYSFFQTRLLQNRYREIVEQDIKFKAYRFEMGNSFWAMRLERITDPAYRDQIELKIWEDPIIEAQYVIGADPAGGQGEKTNNFCISVWRCFADKMVQVAEYAGNRFQSNQCAWVLAGLAGAYRNCMVNLELWGGGAVVMNEFDAIRAQLRQEMYATQNRDNAWDDDFMSTARWFLYRRVDSLGAGFVYNFKTSASNKVALFEGFRNAYQTDTLIVNSMPMLEEMNDMVQEKPDLAPAAPGSLKDDRPFAAALAVWAWNEWLRMPLIAAGATYDRVMNEAAGRNTVAERMMDRLVYSYFSRREAEDDDDEPPAWAGDPWRQERGLM